MGVKASILIGEDKRFLVDIIREAFGKDYRCVCVQTDKYLFEHLHEVDAIVVGLDVCHAEQEKRVEMIRMIRSRFNKPILALTSLQYSSVRIEILKNGADDVLTKPFNPDELVVRVEKLLERYR